jgi:hypothetical protein
VALVTRASVAEAAQETFTYQAEVNRLLDLIVNSLYSNKDVRHTLPHTDSLASQFCGTVPHPRGEPAQCQCRWDEWR